MSIDRYDCEMFPRCPPLGGEVPFRHCRQVNEGLPCHRIVICWQERLPVGEFLRTHYSLEEIERMSRPPRSRLEVILATAERASRPTRRPSPGDGLNSRGEESDT